MDERSPIELLFSEEENMKTGTALVIMLLLVSLSLADIIPQFAYAGIGYSLIGSSVVDYNCNGPAMIALGECGACPGITLAAPSSTDLLTILNSGIHINSSDDIGAFDIVGSSQPRISAYYINVVGSIDPKFARPAGMYVHDFSDGIAAVADPYAYVPDAIYIPIPDLGTISAPGTYSPGYYSGGMQVSSGNIVLQPGDYYLDSIGQNASMHVFGGLITGEGVTLHIIGDADPGVEVEGTASIDLAAPISGHYAGIVIFQKRNPDYNCELSCSYDPASEFNISGNVITDGAIYMPQNKLELGGTGDILARRIIADRISVHGTVEITIVCDSNTYTPGDLTRNGVVNFEDLWFFCLQWGIDGIYIESNLNYDAHLDLNDFAILASHWLEG